ncbi:MAG: hypothetical protein SF053_06820 [Bacteroidia bacterium]|nr:hypothetical protein [Bacteroidia bacterium]
MQYTPQHPDIITLWERIQDSLRRVRGRAAFRGNTTMLLPQGELRIAYEPRGGILDPRYISLWVRRPDMIEVVIPGHPRTQHGTDLPEIYALITQLLLVARQAPYVHTQADQAAYRA